MRCRGRDLKTGNVGRAELLLGVVVDSEESVLGRGIDDLGKVEGLRGGGGGGGWRGQREWESGRRGRGVEWSR